MTVLDRSGAGYQARWWRAVDGSPYSFDSLAVPERVIGELAHGATGRRSIWRWLDWFPMRSWFASPVTLGEGGTPLVAAPWLEGDVRLKLDQLNPTGSFKDRGVALVVTALRAEGCTRLLEDSSGNGGSALAAYAAAAGLSARVLVPEGTSAAKVAATVAYGAEVVIVPGGREATADEALRQVADGRWTYASHAWHPLFPVGVATQALEIWRQLGRRAPATVVVVAGGGSMVLGHALAWRALHQAGLIGTVPRLVLVQPAACAPLVRAWAAGRAEITPGDGVVSPAPGGHAPVGSTAVGHASVGSTPVGSTPGGRPLTGPWPAGVSPAGPTLAEGTAIARPVRHKEVLAALRQLDGVALATGEDLIVHATRELAAHGHYIEPTAANALAGWRLAQRRGLIDRSGTSVIVLSGSGHKAADAMRRVFERRPGRDDPSGP